MPELPEVETVRRSLSGLVGQRLRKVELPDGRLRYRATAAQFKGAVAQQLTGIRRLGKYLLLDFGDFPVLFHLGMTGRLLLTSPGASAYTKVVFRFSQATLCFVDVRRFAFVLAGNKALAALPAGVDALGVQNREALIQKMTQSSAPIKSILLNQKIIAGIGNIYAAEMLFAAGIDPHRRGKRLTAAEAARLITACEKVLRRAIDKKGSSISDFVYSLPGEREYSTGAYQKEFLVYNRAGEPCKNCGAQIQKTVLGGRSTFFCNVCQK
ncbi:bifunctional DNA-formamidopyrimidine glycosylase/DNA-(apurinic or apyrimidinic site) lyase [Turneriella parva]|uniref:Formamidopyrimidine-DNA glycosylase n=1 Tax=Turneriella parva (strain ATCC BAA-1111 / DSM 21527 / NCTC 11395 / H) TaxID=869212 RepID=I4BBA6_TURPD|nr:bifunctional DNA-formamidopyrimidine glycosylase/DNA-(apurinic or apyrimidinic site) lyase [Turneriella parva]AFM14563.1 DNA-(apurinic or apyrimidinic site) lyase, Formamidopyrimidine-DNA glycosylase [Turneriella parva DSM 21527]